MRAADCAGLILGEDGQLLALEAGFETVGKTHAVAVPDIAGRLRNYANRSAGMHDAPIRAAHFGLDDDLGADGENEVRGNRIFGHGRSPVDPTGMECPAQPDLRETRTVNITRMIFEAVRCFLARRCADFPCL